MQNSFAHWQPIYAEARIALLPAVEKRPKVKNGGSFTTSASANLIARYGNAERMGFWCGPASSVTVVDIDSPDPELLASVLRRFGASPIIVRTPSGGHHVWYRHNGENRCHRFEGQLIDILGNGFVMAPPSQTERGSYTFVQGSLAAVNNLPVITEGAWSNAAPARPIRVPPGPSALLKPPVAGSDKVAKGGRNNALFTFCLQQAPTCDDLRELGARAATFNQRNLQPPLSEAEVTGIAASAWSYQSKGRNWVGKGQFAHLPYSAIDGLLFDSPDALLLLVRLIRTHSGLRETFFVANAMASTMARRPWSAKRLARARNVLISKGKLVRAGRRGRAAIYRFGLGPPKNHPVINIGERSDHPTPF